MVISLFKKKNKNEEDFYGDLDNLKNQLGGMGGMSMDMGNNYNIPGTSQNPYDYNNNPGSFSILGNQNQPTSIRISGIWSATICRNEPTKYGWSSEY